MNVALISTGFRVVLIGGFLVAMLLAGCGSGESDTEAKDTAANEAREPAPAASSASETKEPASDPPDGSTPEPETEASTLPVPKDGPTTIKEFPIPSGAEILDMGAMSGNWQFGISSPDAATTLDFYKTTLADKGYTLKEDVSVKYGENTIEWDLAFFGTTYGVVEEDELTGGTLVTVDDEPIDGLKPPQTTRSPSPSEGGKTMTGSAGDAGPSPARDFAGEWSTTFGILRLKASGNHVRGPYEFCDGTLSGTVRGKRLEGTWEEDTSACEDSVSASRTVAEGTFSFKLDPEGEAFTGWYKTKGSPEPNEWDGTRLDVY